MIEPNGEQCAKYFNIPIKDVIDGKGIQRAKNVTWNAQEVKKSDSIDDMDEEQIQRMILRLQASLNEKKQVKEMIKGSVPCDDLPF
jgi:hypothetical protein